MQQVQGKPKVIAVVGPTASGKTSLGIFLAQKVDGEVISADSRQVYKGLDIGTGKVTKAEAKGIPHHLIDVASPKKQFTVDDFVKKSEKSISQILKNSRIPIIVGGTGLYTDVLLGLMSYPNVPPNPKLRAQLEKKSTAELFVQLEHLDPDRAATIEPDHKRRIIRAIEIAKAIGKSPLPNPEKKYDVLWLGLNPSKEKLIANIHKRLKARIKLGMIAEAKQLHKAGVTYKRMDELGLEYRSLARLLQGKLSRLSFEQELERAIQKYAKRQRRWFKRNTHIHWVNNKTEALALVKTFLHNTPGK
ncbi:MAG TPA: tRNA (adenosine(37)-N6)-dimethylallyltransferase MiaA [Candidatus Paceibacterota bacterium]